MNIHELIELLRSAVTVEDIDSKSEEIAELIPNIRVMFGYDQKNQYHCYDLWMHSLHTVLGIPKDNPDDMLFLAALLHDIGKPETQCRSKDPMDPYMHYYGHPEKSAEIVGQLLPPLIYDFTLESKDAVRRLLYYVRTHDERMKEDVLRRHLKEASCREFKNMLLLQIADTKAHILLPLMMERLNRCNAMMQMADELYGIRMIR